MRQRNRSGRLTASSGVFSEARIISPLREPRRPALPSLTGSESIAVVLATTVALIVVGAYLGDRAGVMFAPAVMLGMALGFGAFMLARLSPWAVWDRTETVTFAVIVAITFIWLLWIARPSFFPLGGGPD